MRLLLLSNGSVPGGQYLAHAVPTLRQLLSDAHRVAFVGYAERRVDEHTEIVAAALASLHLELIGVHRHSRPRSVVESADAVFIGGGNAFRLLASSIGFDLSRRLVGGCDGAPFVGSRSGGRHQAHLAVLFHTTSRQMPIG